MLALNCFSMDIMFFFEIKGGGVLSEHLHCSVALYVASVSFARESVIVCACWVVVCGGVPEILSCGNVFLVIHFSSPAIVNKELGVGEAFAFDKVFYFKYVVVAVSVGCYHIRELQEVVCYVYR